jgi:putative hydrolase of the HAD superfamily
MAIVRPENMDFSGQKFSAIIYGSPGVGKTTLALSAPAPVLIDFDRGISRVRAQHRQPTIMCNTYEEVLARFIQNDPQLEEMIHKVFMDLHGILGLYDYTESWIRQLKEAGYGVYYLSNFFQKADEDCRELMGFLELMDGGILSYKDKVTKPDPEIYELLLSRYGLNAEECVFLDDTEKNIVGARAVGIQGILFQDRIQAVAELQKLGVKTE